MELNVKQKAALLLAFEPNLKKSVCITEENVKISHKTNSSVLLVWENSLYKIFLKVHIFAFCYYLLVGFPFTLQI